LKEDGDPLTLLVEKSANMSAQAPQVGLLAKLLGRWIEFGPFSLSKIDQSEALTEG
jgi:hypothetical protein